MTLQQLKYFCTMAKVLHYTEAAKLLFVSQSSLSYSLSELEKELGAPLFEKQGKKNALTKYGESFLPFAKKSLAQLDEGVNLIEKMLRSHSVINLGYVYSLSFDCLPNVVRSFCSRAGNEDVSFSFFQGLSSIILEKLKKGELDFALSTSPPRNDDRISSFPIYDQPLYLVIPKNHPLAAQETINPQDLQNQKFVSISKDSSLRHQIDDVFQQLGINQQITFEAEECNAMASFVSSQFGMAIMPEIPSISSFDLVAKKIDSPLFTRKIHLVWVKEHFFAPSAQQFRRFLESAYSNGI